LFHITAIVLLVPEMYWQVLLFLLE